MLLSLVAEEDGELLAAGDDPAALLPLLLALVPCSGLLLLLVFALPGFPPPFTLPLALLLSLSLATVDEGEGEA